MEKWLRANGKFDDRVDAERLWQRLDAFRWSGRTAPFGLRDWQGEDAFADPRWSLGLPPQSEPELAWVQHCLAHLEPDGDAVVLLPPAVAARSTGRRLRAELVRQGRLRAVVALPSGALPETGIAPMLWLLRGEASADPGEGVIMVDVSSHAQGRRISWSDLRPVVEEALTDPEAAEASVARRVPTIDLLDEKVDLSPRRHLQPLRSPARDLGSTWDSFRAVLGDLDGALPATESVASPPTLRWVSLGDLARAGTVTLAHGPSTLAVSDGGAGSEANPHARAVLTATDVAQGRDPSGRLDEPDSERLTELREGDVVLPLVAARPVARVIETGGAVLGRHLLLVRTRSDAFDPWFLAGVLQGEQVTRATSSTTSGTHRLVPRHVEVPVLPLDEQRALAAAFRRLHEFESAMSRARRSPPTWWRHSAAASSTGRYARPMKHCGPRPRDPRRPRARGTNDHPPAADRVRLAGRRPPARRLQAVRVRQGDPAVHRAAPAGLRAGADEAGGAGAEGEA